METVYKLTDKDGKTRAGKYNEKQWGEGITHTDTGAKELCGPGWLHAYTSPFLAVLLNSSHANFDKNTMILWECEAEVGLRRADKIGCTKLTTVKQIPLPVFTTTQYQAFAILVAKEVYKDSQFQIWSDNWLYSKDRSIAAAYAAANAAYVVAYAADVAANAANAAANAAYAAANAAYAAYAAADAAATAAANAAANATYVAAHAADAAYAALDLDKIVKEAMAY